MQITYLGHAGFLVETDAAVLVADPWLSPEGAFDSGWFQLPRNHDLAPQVREKLETTSKKRFVYISHEHRDHFDIGFLRSLPTDQITFLVPHFQRDALRAEIGHLQPAGMVLCKHGAQVEIPGGEVKLFLDDSGINRDSSILIKADGQAFLNLNDCKLNDELASISKSEGPISIFACQFSGATWHPTCYEYSEEEYQRISKQKLTGKFEMVARAIETVRPRFYLPSAGPACFLDPRLIHLNFQPVNIFPRAPQFFEYLQTRLPDSATEVLDIMPGDVVCAETGQLQQLGTERVDEANFESYIRAYAARYADYFAAKGATPAGEKLAAVMDGLKAALQRKLDAFELHDRLRIPLYFGLSDVPGRLLRVDFPSRAIAMVSEITDADYYSLFTPSWQIARVLEKAITWEEFALTFRVRLNRKPDVYQTLIQGFLLLESEDMNWFCRKLLEIEQSRSRIVVEVAGVRYSIDRFCPHQGADLTQGWADEGRLWTCPRHRWQFALDKEGQCLTGTGSVHAVCVEPD